MVKTTQEMITATYMEGRRVANSSITETEAAKKVARETSMNEDSAKMYIHCVVALLRGGAFRSVKADALDYYLSRISEDEGKVGLTRALETIEEHIKLRVKPVKEIAEKYYSLLKGENDKRKNIC